MKINANPGSHPITSSVEVEFSPVEYTDLFLNPDGLFARYFETRPDELAKLRSSVRQVGMQKIIGIELSPPCLEAVGRIFGRTSTDHKFLKTREDFLTLQRVAQPARMQDLA